MSQSFYLNSSTIGVDLNNASATALFAVGTHVLGTNDTEWVYVQANTSIVSNTIVCFNSGTFTCGMASAGDSILGGQLATAQTSISSQAYGWVAIRGIGLSVQVLGTTTAGSNIYVAGAGGGSGTGALTSNVSGSTTAFGIVQISGTVSATATGSATPQNVAVFNLFYPRWNAQVG